MGRRPDPRRRAELLELTAAYLEQHGLADMSLRPLASALGTTPRGLLYHFGSKEHLLAEAVRHLQARYERLDSLTEGGSASIVDVARRIWQQGTAPEANGFLRLYFELFVAALRSPIENRAFLDGVIGQWLEPLMAALEATGMTRRRARLIATQLVALNTGLALDLLATSDRSRVEEAYEAFLTQIAEELNRIGK